MPLIEILTLAFSLAADAFAVSVGAGATGATRDTRSMVRLSFHFGLFQFLMPVIGWMAGLTIESYIEPFDHWVAFILLTWVAVRMVQSARGKNEDKPLQDPSRGALMVMLSIATSLDALAVGLSLALIDISIWYPAVIIGVITGTTSFVGILMGKKFSPKLGKKAELIGGILLFIIGVRILISHIIGV